MNLTHPDIIYWVATTYLNGIGPVRLRQWVEQGYTLKELFSATPSYLQARGFNQSQCETIQHLPWEKIENDIGWYEKNNGHILIETDEDYPLQLREIAGAPFVLYVQGNKSLLTEPQIAIVGSRNPTQTGLETATQFAFGLSQAGLTVTSGLALGIDAAGHQGALAATGKTIAVMGTGLRQVYPRSHLPLAEKIRDQGAIVSEFPLDAGAKATHFPLRNRLISGLSLGVLVVEAALKSGSLITARFARDQGREVFAIPGSIHHPLSKGCHYLIREGAKLVENLDDIGVELPILQGLIHPSSFSSFKKTEARTFDLDDMQKEFLVKMGYEPTALDLLVSRSGLTRSEVSSMLLTLELKGYVATVPGGYSRI